jgi:hypothetical protein
MRDHLRPLVAAAALGVLTLGALEPAYAADTPAVDGTATVSVSAHPLTPANAPADEYFGRLKLSNLGVRNIIKAFVIEGNSPLALPMQRARMEAVDSAILDWGDRYPRDPWLPSAVFRFTDVLAVKGDVKTDAMAMDLLLQASQRYRNTKYAKMALDRVRALQPACAVDWSVVPFDPPGLADLVAIKP